jgi:hypothetical protein
MMTPEIIELGRAKDGTEALNDEFNGQSVYYADKDHLLIECVCLWIESRYEDEPQIDARPLGLYSSSGPASVLICGKSEHIRKIRQVWG